MLDLRRFSNRWVALAPMLLTACSGADETTTDTPMPSPPSEFGESIEDQRWGAWHTYQDEMVSMNLYTDVIFFEYRDGLWCGELMVHLAEPGSYLAYNLGDGWVTVIDVPEEAPGDDTFNMARLYGTLVTKEAAIFKIDAWMDSINDHVPSTPADQTPAMEYGNTFFSAYFQEMALVLDPSDLTLAEFMDYTADYPATGRVSGIDPATTHIDMPPYALTYTGPFASGLEEEWCYWCMQPGDETVYEPL